MSKRQIVLYFCLLCAQAKSLSGVNVEQMSALTQTQDNPLPKLRPLSVGELLDESIHLYRSNWLRFLTVAAVTAVPLSVLDLGAALLVGAATTSSLQRTLGPMLLMVAQAVQGLSALLSVVLVNGLMLGALIHTASQRYMGRDMTLGDAYLASVRRLLPLLGATFLMGFLNLAMFAAILIPCIGWLGGPPMWVFVTTNLSVLCIPVIMLEGKGVFESLRRSWMLAKSHFWRLLLLLASTYLLSVSLIGGPVMVVVFGIVVLTENVGWATAGSAIVQTVANLIFLPIWGVCLTLLYYDTRVRQEAFDLEMVLGTHDLPAPEDRGPLMSPADWKNVLILGVLVIGVPILLVTLGILPFLVLGMLR